LHQPQGNITLGNFVGRQDEQQKRSTKNKMIPINDAECVAVVYIFFPFMTMNALFDHGSAVRVNIQFSSGT
jgi:hypothetical protein